MSDRELYRLGTVLDHLRQRVLDIARELQEIGAALEDLRQCVSQAVPRRRGDTLRRESHVPHEDWR